MLTFDRSPGRTIPFSLGRSLFGLALVILPACGVDSNADDDGGAATVRDDALATSFTMTCSKLTVSSGKIGSGQTVAALATADLSGTQDVWSKYVEFWPKTSATCDYALPAGVSAGDLASLSLAVNYRGPLKADMRWTFEAWDAVAAAWVVVGDNTFASEWTWSSATLALPAPVARFSSNGKLKIRYKTTSSVDSSDLDRLVLIGTTSGGGGSGGSGGSTGGSGGSTGGSGGSGGSTGGSGGSTGGSGGSTGGSGGSGGAGGVWVPAPGTSWQWQITGTIDTSLSVAMYDIDLFEAPQATIDSLRASGKKVICYFSAGSYEDWRPDVGSFPASALGNPLDGWAGERWLDTRDATVRTIMKARLDLAVNKHCDGVEPDNVDGYTNNPGFPLTSSTQIDYNKFLAAEAHARGLSVGLKNDLDQVTSLVSSFDWALNEECYKNSECNLLSPFISAGKAVFHTEYGSASLATTVCPATKPLGFSTLIKNLDLDAWRVACP